MSEKWQYQLRLYLNDALADVARTNPADPVLQPLTVILDKHDTVLVSQFDAFQNYVTEAERDGPDQFPLYKWTKATVEDPVKRAKYISTFALRVSGHEVYEKHAADALEADLRPLVGGDLVMRLSRHDTNPSNNPQVPPEYR